jgi:L-threonylcarbamoyladenylate synthase
MLDRHYAPRARLVLLLPDGSLPPGLPQGEAVAALMRTLPPPRGVVQARTLPSDPAGYARELYDAIHELDGAGVAAILVEPLPPDSAWAGIRDRLHRALHL